MDLPRGVCEHDNLPTSAEGKLWKDWIRIQVVWLEQHQILKKFKKPKEAPKYPTHIQRGLDHARFIVDPVRNDSVDFEVPMKLPLINRHVWYWRPIPTKVSGEQLKAAYIKWYLCRKIDERLAAGGYRKWQKNWEDFVHYMEHP
jgi:hypothetical protein